MNDDKFWLVAIVILVIFFGGIALGAHMLEGLVSNGIQR